ncbi:hypothetical protein SHAb15599_00109 [Acinetobacter phage SH-Ab 15599]|nr:hypothetical protein SHAb15599_00109 [Acinetobacter phage SH-Ab 15599]
MSIHMGVVTGEITDTVRMIMERFDTGHFRVMHCPEAIFKRDVVCESIVFDTEYAAFSIATVKGNLHPDDLEEVFEYQFFMLFCAEGQMTVNGYLIEPEQMCLVEDPYIEVESNTLWGIAPIGSALKLRI